MPKVDSKHFLKINGLVSPKSTHPAVKKLKRQGHKPSIHGNKIWASSFALMALLKKEPLKPRTKVMDLGCGWGLLCCFLALKFDARVVGVDADQDVEPFFDLTANLNGVELKFLNSKFEKLDIKTLSGTKVITGCDICFWDELVKPLFNVIKRAQKAGVKKVYIADPGRSSFFALADRCEKKFDCEIITQQIKKPTNSEKYILSIRL